MFTKKKHNRLCYGYFTQHNRKNGKVDGLPEVDSQTTAKLNQSTPLPGVSTEEVVSVTRGFHLNLHILSSVVFTHSPFHFNSPKKRPCSAKLATGNINRKLTAGATLFNVKLRLDNSKDELFYCERSNRKRQAVEAFVS